VALKMVPARSGSWARSSFGKNSRNDRSRTLRVVLEGFRCVKVSEVPLFEKEGLGEICFTCDDLAALEKSPSIPLFQRGKFGRSTFA
jgi:hypothetical protein